MRAEQSVAIFIAILGLVSLSSGFSLIVVMVLYIEREFVLYIDGFVLIVEGFGLFFFYIILVRVTPAARRQTQLHFLHIWTGSPPNMA